MWVKLFCVFISIGFTIAAEKTEIAVSINDDVSFTCTSDSIAVWTKEDKSSHTILASGTSILPNWDSTRYSFSQKGRNYLMTIKGASSDDAGIYICNNNFKFSLVIIGAPRCGPEVASVVEDRHYDFSCSASLFGSATNSKASTSWSLGSDSLQAEDKNEIDKIESSISYTAKYLDHEKELKCEINHPNWHTNKPKPFCTFGKLNVHFEPKIKCPSNLLFKPEDKEYLIKCNIIGNPLPSVSAIKWEFEQKAEKLKIPSFQTKADSIEATLKLTNHHLSVRKSNRLVTLKVPNALNPDNAVVSKQISVGLIHGPVVSCPEKIQVERKDKGVAKVECRIHVNPIPPNSNISWYVDDDFIQRQRQDMIEPIPGGIVAKFEVQTENYGQDSLHAILKISGYQTVASDKVEILVSEMQKDEKVYRGKNDEKGGSFVNSNNGLMLLGGGTFFLMILTIVVALVFYKKGFFSSNESQYGTRAVIAQGTMADSEFFGIADKGYDSGTFQFYQPKNTLDPHGTMTMKLMKRIKESERDSEWTEGFAKMANALYLKDTDQDGYLTVMEAKPVVLSYSDIYHLGITETKLDEVFTQCSNGQHVDVETLLRMISLPTSV